MRAETKDRWTSRADVSRVAQRHNIPPDHRHELEQVMEVAALAALQSQLNFQMNRDRLNLTKSGREFGQFVGALRRAKKLLARNDVRSRLRYAGAVSHESGIVTARYEKQSGIREVKNNSFEDFVSGDALADQLLDRLLRLAVAGEGNAKEDKPSSIEDAIISAAAALIPFWHSVLGRPVRFNDWDGDPAAYLLFVDDVLSSFMQGENFERYVRDRKSKVIAHLQKVGLSNLAGDAIC